ncbi:MAG TPA: hypothetical protein VI755_07965 [Anaerolineales bacterium]|nr:hypothetical protein [Anaerolineales bacterium]
MNINRKTTISEGGKLANTNRQTVIKENKKPTASKLIRWAGLPAMAAGIIFIAIQPIHPPDILSSVTTSTWAIVTSLKTAMCLLGLLGITGLYARQAEKAGWLGLAGYLLFSLFFVLTLPFAFAEAFILPLLATEAPKFVESILGLASGSTGGMDLGALAVVYKLAGFLGYIFGGLLFGIATFRAGILPRWAAGLLAFAAVSVLAGALLPHPLDRIMAVPMGLALTWLGYSLLSERREPASEPLPGMARPQPVQTGAD